MTTLRLALRNYADFEHALDDEARLFEAAHPGVHVDLVAVGIHELYDRALRDRGLRNGDFDLALLVTDWLAEGMAAGALEDLHARHERLPLPDWPDGWPHSLVRPLYFGERLSAIPWHDGPECLVYRTDLFNDPERQAAFRAQFHRDLAPPTTWDEFAQTARFFTNRDEKVYGTVFAAFPDGHNTLYDFALQLWSRGGEFVDADGRTQLASPQAIAAIDFYRNLVRDPAACHPASPQLDSTQSGDLFMKGEVAMMANWFGFATRSSAPGSALHGKVAIAPIPCAPGRKPISLSVFWALVMGSGSRQKDLAWEFLRFVTTPERDLGIIRHGTVGCRLSTWRNPQLQAEIPVYRHVEAISLAARQLPAGPQMAAFAAIIDSVVTRALSTQDATAAILEEAQHEIEARGIRFS
ncbi:MAG TPA: sugar ABC transporter substrate-binding protein [Terracidiphilus sp.]|nr:sugar ABC transporter substrate-binding protein [Terracidiphilus sp.]